jgi:hypothetical protein
MELITSHAFEAYVRVDTLLLQTATVFALQLANSQFPHSDGQNYIFKYR